MQNSCNKQIKNIITSGGFLLFVSYMSLSAVKGFYSVTCKYYREMLGCGYLLIFSTFSMANEHKMYQFDIPKQSLTKSLNELSDHTETLVLFPYDLVEKHQGSAVKGQFTLIQAIDKLLLDTGLFGGFSKKEVLMISERQSTSRDNTHNNGNENMKTKKVF